MAAMIADTPKKYFILLFLTSFSLLLTSIPAQTIIFNDQNTTLPIFSEPESVRNDPYYTWQDNFNTEEYIDPALSSDYTLNNGVAQIKNTYTAWTDPSWTRLMPISLTNNQGQPLTDFAVQLTIPYDTDMDSNYTDLRFKHEDYTTIWLDYWIEDRLPTHAKVWIKIPTIPVPPSMMYVFYGNPSASDESDFYAVFTSWQEKWANDEQITYHLPKEGAWDPDVTYGDNHFLVTWEEGQAPNPPYTWLFEQEIRGSLYDGSGDVINSDFPIRTGTSPYRHENPSSAYGDNTYFVAWEHYGSPTDVTTMNIKGKLVSPTGTVGSEIAICNEVSVQADPHVSYDTENNRFFVVWEDAREGVGNYNLYGKLYSNSGTQIGGEKIICNAGNPQAEPWTAFDPINEQYMIVWEEGETAANGPYDVYVGLFDKDLNLIGPGPGSSALLIADGSTNTDYIFPCVSFSEESQRYLITWNDADVSSGQTYGDLWGTILDSSGTIVVPTFQIRQGQFARSDIVPYLSSSYLVSYDCGTKIWGKIVASNGNVFSGEIQISASTAAIADKGNLAVGNGRIFTVWEDKRIVYPAPWNGNPDAFCNLWRLSIPTGSEVTSSLGQEKKLILTAQITSKPIQPQDLITWYNFDYQSTGSIFYDILDAAGTVIINNASGGEDLTSISPTSHPALRLQAHFFRSTPATSPELDLWNITYVGEDDVPPETTIEEIIGTQGNNNWYLSNVNIKLDATDGVYGTGVNHTYYTVNGSAPYLYDDNIGIKLPFNNPNQLYGSWDVTYWSEDKAGNIEPPQGPITIKIDKAAPYAQILTPPDRATVTADFWVEVQASDFGSGVNYVLFDTGPPYEDPVVVYNDDPPGSGTYRWLCTRHFVKQWKHLIAQVYDNAGHMYEHNIYIYFSNRHDGVFNPGYIYLFGNQTIGPLNLLYALEGAIALDYNVLYVRLPSWHTEGISVEFTARKLLLQTQYTFTDDDLTDGSSCEMDLPWGFYEITAKVYDDTHTLVQEQLVIKRMLIMLIG
jgi:hypothetical protein